MAYTPTTRDEPVHVLFIGAGAVGCFYASRLHHVTRPLCPYRASLGLSPAEACLCLAVDISG